jgi:hypothetical protein
MNRNHGSLVDRISMQGEQGRLRRSCEARLGYPAFGRGDGV